MQCDYILTHLAYTYPLWKCDKLIVLSFPSYTNYDFFLEKWFEVRTIFK